MAAVLRIGSSVMFVISTVYTMAKEDDRVFFSTGDVSYPVRLTAAYKAKVGVVFGLVCLILLVLALRGPSSSSSIVSAITGGATPNPEDVRRQKAVDLKNEKLRHVLRQSVDQFIDAKDGGLVIPSDSQLKKLDLNELEELYMRYIENTQVNCPRMLHVGWEYDGGYHICETTIPKPPCLMYSFGIRKDFVFENGVSQTYGCEVHAFDPFDGVDDFQEADKVYFHDMGIGGKNEKVTIFPNTPQEQTGIVKTLGTLKRMLNHRNRTIDVLKMDTEGAEWFALQDQINTGTLRGVTLLIVEFHVWVGDANAFEHATHPVRSIDGYMRYLSDLRGVYEQGFRIYFFRMWTWCSFKDEIKNRRTACHEVHFMRDNK